MTNKVYVCCVCHKVLNRKPHRLVLQEYALKPYKQYKNKCNYDLCDDCYKHFINWVNKHNDKEGSYDEK